MLTILVLVCFIAILGAIVAYISTLPINPILMNLIYLVVTVGVLVMIIYALQSGHLPTLRLS